jgi:hypothetical protein
MAAPGPATTIRPNPRAVFRTLADDAGGVVLHLDTAAYHSVNGFGAHVWGLLDGGVAFDALIATIEAAVDDAPATLREEVGTFLSDLHERDLVRYEDPAEAAG